MRIEEISQTDAAVIAVAREQQITILSEGILLRKKAERTGVSAIERLKGVLGLDNLETTIEYLLKTAVSRERVLGVVRSYQNQQKTLRQCAEALNVELDEVIEILQEHGAVFHHDDLPQRLEVVNRLAQQMKTVQTQC